MVQGALSAPIIQEYIVPVVAFDQRGGQAYYRKLLGTAFFVGSRGIFVTAKHVVEQAIAFVNAGGAEGWAVSGKFPIGTSQDALLPVTGMEYAHGGLDIAVGCSNVPVPSPLKFTDAMDVTGWNVGSSPLVAG
jgi:hypothetical protein